MYIYRSAYERVSARLLRNQPKPKPYCKFENGKLLVGTESLHKTGPARIFRLFWRLKYNRR